MPKIPEVRQAMKKVCIVAAIIGGFYFFGQPTKAQDSPFPFVVGSRLEIPRDGKQTSCVVERIKGA